MTQQGGQTRPASRKAVVVLGMHRSGTSALAGLLTRLGCDGPATPLGPSANNPIGHFESQPLYLLQDELLASAGSSWVDYQPFPDSWMTSPKGDEFRGRLRDLLEAEYGNSGFFVVKDPRNCRMVPLWREVLAGLQIQPLFVHTHRNPLEVAGSLQERNGLDLEYGCLVWLRHILDAEAGSRGQIRSFTSYDQLLEDWPTEVEKIASDLGISWPRYTGSQVAQLNAMIAPELKHNSAGNLLGSQIFPRWIREIHDVFSRWSASGEDTADQPLLDEIRRAFDESSSVFNGVVHGKGKTLAAERDEARKQAAEANAKDTEHQQTIDALAAERDEARKQTVEANAKNTEHQQAIEALAAERDSLVGQLHLNLSMLAQRKAEIDDGLHELQMVRDALAEAELQHANITLELGLAHTRIQTLQAGTARRDLDLARFQTLALRYQDEIAAANALIHAGPRTEVLLDSTSWRWTDPLRRIVLRFRE